MNMSDYAPLFVGCGPTQEALTPEFAGSKAAMLGRMSQLGLNVPPAFVLPIALCAAVNRRDPDALDAMAQSLRQGVARLEERTGRRIGDDRLPLLVSVRSGAAQSMPGMLSTILNVGLNHRSVHGLIRLTGNPRLAWDSYRRFVQMYAETVLGLPAGPFEARLNQAIVAEGVGEERHLDSETFERLAHDYRAIVERAGAEIPDDPMKQLAAASLAVFSTWNAPRALEYRRLNRLEALQGTAVTVQAMAFGNAGGQSGAGVAFSRNPATGANELYADFVFDAQGEDVVAGRRIPGTFASLSSRLPEVARALSEGAVRLEQEFRAVQDVEFTVEDGTLYFLQTRAAKLTPRASLRVLVDFVHEGLLDPAAAVQRADAIDLGQASVTRFAADIPAIATAIPASPGVASGRVAFDCDRARWLAAKDPVILVRHDTSTDDVAGFAVAAGILTAVGGRTAHAAVAARQLGKVCLVGCKELKVDADGQHAEIAGARIREGDWISLDGDHGRIMLGRNEIITEPPGEMAEIAAWRAGAGATDRLEAAG